ncbi:Crp/Fnr family transcriptional regulator [Algoriphagus sp. AGSA1]|uniref:Crp/Fnr family transcriptional regulator n=1 Tax=Algoriphagus sp. AGSA1 TaxID=2907213 RepID=UPI001F170C49|nr:Crp/Fnr family transcriptional regulator [Algoriphagus sp. AGSA1]MCE7054269.1 Crp/Fnr family transcriptional regulator [Algoriphagus sp. AGSA1]
MKAFIDYISQFGDLNQHQIDFILGKATRYDLRKGEYFSEAGKIPTRVGFVLEGIMRFCYFNNKGDEITHLFMEENNFVTDYQKFEEQVEASEYVQAITDCKLLIFSKKDWDDISNTIIGWDTLVEKIYKKCLIETLDRRSPLVSEDATTRYLTFIEKFQTLINRIPLSYVASYLGITQQSLSRIRKNIR